MFDPTMNAVNNYYPGGGRRLDWFRVDRSSRRCDSDELERIVVVNWQYKDGSKGGVSSAKITTVLGRFTTMAAAVTLVSKALVPVASNGTECAQDGEYVVD